MFSYQELEKLFKSLTHTCMFGEGFTNSLKNLSKLNGDLKHYDLEHDTF